MPLALAGVCVMTRAIPTNRLGRAEREARWLDAAEEGRRNRAHALEPEHWKNAKYVWLKFIADSAELPSSAKLVAHTLALYGNAAGENIFPGIRELERSSSLSGRSVADQIDLLVRKGWLMRKERRTGKAWTMGVVYQLCLPLGVITDENAERLQVPKLRGVELSSTLGAESASTPGAEPTSTRAERPSAPSLKGASEGLPGARGAERGAGGAERNARGAEPNSGGAEPGSIGVLNHVQPTSPSYLSNDLSKDLSKQCPPSRTVCEGGIEESSPEIQRKRRQAAALNEQQQSGGQPRS